MHMYLISQRGNVHSSRGNSMCKDMGVRQCVVFHLEKCKYKDRGMNIVGNNVGDTDRN